MSGSQQTRRRCQGNATPALEDHRQIRIRLIICVKSLGRRGEGSLSLVYLHRLYSVGGVLQRLKCAQVDNRLHTTTSPRRRSLLFYLFIYLFCEVEGIFRKKLKDFLLSSYLGCPFPSPASCDINNGSGPKSYYSKKAWYSFLS